MEVPYGLLGIDEEGEKSPPETRLKTASDGRRLYLGLKREDRDGGRALSRALAKGMVDGNPPYNDAKRKAEKREWECNLNFMEGRAIMNRTAVPYYNLFARVPHYVECRTAFQPDHPDWDHWNSSISRRFSNMLKRWKPGFNWNIQQVSYWMRLHGIGFPLFDKDNDWRFRSVPTGMVFVPKDSPSALDERIPYVCISMPYRILELWERIKDPKTATKAGWDVENVRAALKYGMRGLGGTQWWTQSWEYYEQILHNHDLTSSFSDSDIIDCVIMFYREFSGKISKVIFTETQVASLDPNKPKKAKPEDKDFLYQDIGCYDKYTECLCPFFRDTGDGTWHSVRGYAMEAFKHVEIDNRLLCRAFDRGFIDSSLVLQSATARGKDRLQLGVWSGAVVQLPTGSEFKPTTVQGGTDGMVQLHNLIRAHLINNLGVSQTNVNYRQDGRGEMPTARQVDYQAANEASISEGEITIWYEQKDLLYSEMFRRAVKYGESDEEAKRFRDECYNDGVPKEALKDMEYVRANRQNGYGSPEMGLMRMRQGQELVPMMPEDGKQNWIEDAVTTVYGPEKTERYAPRSHTPDDQDWQISVENGQIAAGQMPVIYGTQDDVQHCVGHLADARQTLQPLAAQMNNGGSDPGSLQQMAQYSSLMVRHIEEHIARLKNDPSRKAQAKLFEDQLGQLGDFSQEIWRELRSAQRDLRVQAEQEQQATALSALDQAKIQSVQTGAAAAAAKTQSQIENQRAKTIQQLQLKALKTGQDLHLDRLTTAHDIGLERAQAFNDMQTERMAGTPENE